MASVLHTLMQRRTSRRGPAYIPWLLIYVMSGLTLWHGKGDRSPGEALALWPGVIPLCVVGVQCFRPTILGWATVLVLALLYDGFLVYLDFLIYSVRDQSTDSLFGTILTLIFVAVFIIVPIALIVAARPKASPHPPPNTYGRSQAWSG
jgi:hypothetical protein